ncbi:MAG: cation transporter [Chitinophagaceae bacterium]|nr:cation transporter [Chitinophagaceae bacterium]MBK8953594.1 cation transporter [Chitinophagaceae bacterium]
MKTIKLLSAAVLLLAFTFNSSGQTKTESFQVSGNCGMCKTRIEKAAKEAGAAAANWNADSKQLTVTYESSLTNTAKIQQKIADVGHDNPGFKTTADVYNKLPGCCKYERVTDAKEEKHTCSDKCEKKDGKCTKMESGNAAMNCGMHKDDSHKTEGHEGKSCCKKDGDKAQCTKEGHDGKACCKKEGDKAQCAKEGHDGKACCKKEGDKAQCAKEGHNGKDCCKKDDAAQKMDCCKDGAKCEKH